MYYDFRTCLAWEGFTETNKRRHTGQQPGTNSASRRADKPKINREWTADGPRVNRGFCSPVGFKYELDCSCFRRDVQDSCLRYPGGHEGQMSPGRAGPSTSFPARPCAAPPRPARGMSGFWTRQVTETNRRRHNGQQPRLNNALSLADKPHVQRLLFTCKLLVLFLHRFT